ncbi:MAG TPA: DJ-1/PfpI family protein [Nitriliruptoraceae bacterium]|nr:DJ-1/PfpI family protein [Nitriliruptoraceae bacterium]
MTNPPDTTGDTRSAPVPIRVGIVVFDTVDLLDVGGPYEVLLTANRLVERAGGPPPLAIETVAVGDGSITAYGGLGLGASTSMADADGFDVLVVPGTIDVDAVIADRAVMADIEQLAQTTPLVTTVCTGAVILAAAGHLDTVARATTHHEDVAVLAESIGPRAVTARWVDAGDIITSGGLSSGIAMALHLVERLVDRDLAVATAAQIAYEWDPADGIVTA